MAVRVSAADLRAKLDNPNQTKREPAILNLEAYKKQLVADQVKQELPKPTK